MFMASESLESFARLLPSGHAAASRGPDWLNPQAKGRGLIFRILYRQDFQAEIAGRPFPGHGVADGGAVQGLCQGRDPADPVLLRIGFVLTDDAEFVLLVIVVDAFHERAEADLVCRLAGG